MINNVPMLQDCARFAVWTTQPDSMKPLPEQLDVGSPSLTFRQRRVLLLLTVFYLYCPAGWAVALGAALG